MSCAETVELIKMLFGMLSGMGPRKHVLDGDPEPPCPTSLLSGKGAAHCKVSDRLP